jgi:CspA family cold shock protein
MSSETTSSQNQGRIVGKVKWFNNKAGYGFITVNDSQFTDKDIFVHYSDINVSNSQYKYLVQGEYVEFLLEKIDSDKHEFKATGVTGINGGTIMCETRNRNPNPRASGEGAESRRPRRQPREEGVTQAADAGDSKNDDEEGFTTIVKKRVAKKRPAAPKK